MKKLVLTLMASLLIALATHSVVACSCGRESLEDSFKSSKMVILAKFLEPDKSGSRFRVLKAWKGAKKGQKVLLFLFDLLGCDRDIVLVKGRDYLLFVFPKGDGLARQGDTVFVDCMRSIEATNLDAVDDMRVLDKTEAVRGQKSRL